MKKTKRSFKEARGEVSQVWSDSSEYSGSGVKQQRRYQINNIIENLRCHSFFLLLPSSVLDPVAAPGTSRCHPIVSLVAPQGLLASKARP